mgnify:CR=1 FL=1
MLKPKISLKARAFRYISMREHSRSELSQKLSRYVEVNDDLVGLLDFLEKSQFLSAERFSESLINRKQARFGNQRILAELKNHRIDPNQYEHLQTALVCSEAARAIAVLQRKFQCAPTEQHQRAKQMRFLLQRGFSSDAVRVAMRDAYREDDHYDQVADTESLNGSKFASR